MNEVRVQIRGRVCLRAGLLLCLLLSGTGPLASQAPAAGGRGEVFVGSEIETYLRLLQVRGRSPLYPWTIRSFSPGEVERILPADTLHPWAAHYDLSPRPGTGLQLDWIVPQARFIYNSAFPYGSNDGAVWAGRGLTTALQAGFAARYGPFSLTVAPLVFRAENTPFEVMPHDRDDQSPYADWRFPSRIDLPQRFGDAAYMRVDPGQSTARADIRGFSAGVSTANQHWGPAVAHPILLGNNAPGFLHAFLGTATPQIIGIGRAHGRFVWGKLEQSAYSPMPDTASARFMSGVTAVYMPRWLPGLEVGAARFFHEVWPEKGLGAESFLRPFDLLFKGTPGRRDLESFEDAAERDSLYYTPTNQLASLFARWVFPESGFEVYGEYGKEDHNVGFRDLLLQVDHNAGYALGFRKVWNRSPTSMLSLRGELLNLQISHILQVRDQSPFYHHHRARQGHTHRGQLLGSSAGYGGGGSLLAADYYHPRGRWTLAWSRELRAEHFTYYFDQRNARGIDVVQGFGGEGLFFLGRFDITAGLTWMTNFNRHFQNDVSNVNATLRIRAGI